MTPAEVPSELIEILNQRAGRDHSRTGSVVATLAEILTRYEQLKTRHVTHRLGTVSIPMVQPHEAGALTRHVTRKDVVFCHECPLYVEQPDGMSDVGAAVAKWNREHPS